MMTLYNRGDCPFCWKVRLALAELQIEYELVNIKLGEKHPDVIRYNPKASVPVLVDNETVIWESSAIVEYLDDKYAPNRLFLENAELRARIRLLVSYSDSVIGPALRESVFEKRSKPEGDWDLEKIQQSEDAWRACLRQLSIWLDGEDFFCAKFSAAECALLPRFSIANAYGLSSVVDDFPLVKRWFFQLKQRPSYSQTCPESFSQYSAT